jgi:hypothetical protein
MPTVFRHGGYRFFFYSNEGDPREPIHIHVRDGSGEAKFWIRDEIALARSDGFDARTLRRLSGLVNENRDLIVRSWDEYFSA